MYSTPLTGPDALRKSWNEKDEKEYERAIAEIEAGMKTQGFVGGSVLVALTTCPSRRVRARIEADYISVGWKSVKFRSEQRDGTYVVLSE